MTDERPLILTVTLDPHVEPRMCYKVCTRWSKKHYDWLSSQNLEFDTHWFSQVDPENVDHEIYYFAQETDAVRFVLTWM